MKDSEIIEALHKDSELAFKILFERYYDRLKTYISNYTQDTMASEDIVQNMFTNLWINRHKLKHAESLRVYLHTVAYHNYIDSIRKEKRERKFLETLRDEALLNRIEEDREAVDRRIETVRSLMEELPDRCREVIKLHKLQGLKYKEIAEQLGISTKTVERHMNRALKQLREGVEKSNLFLFMFFKKKWV